jgi:hypothetical protein
VKETHGVICKKVEQAFAEDEMAVRIYDGDDYVGVIISTDKFRPRLTYEEAVFLSKQLSDAAKRLQARQK